MFHALEDVICERELGPFSELGSLVLAFDVDVLDPAVMGSGSMLLILISILVHNNMDRMRENRSHQVQMFLLLLLTSS